MKAYQAGLAKFEENDTQVFGISVDSVPANAHWAQELGVTFPLLSDFNRKVVGEYGIYNAERGFANRATFVIDKEGKIQHIEEGRDAIDPSGADTACQRLKRK
jgi:peroxiredoxin